MEGDAAIVALVTAWTVSVKAVDVLLTKSVSPV